MCARTHFEIFDKNLILHSKFQKKSMLMTQYRLLSHRKWLSIRYWGMLRNALLWGPWSLKFRHLLNRWPWPNIVGCHYCCGPTKPPILDLFAITQHSILSHNKLLSIEYWVLKDTESLYFTISTLCIVTIVVAVLDNINIHKGNQLNLKCKIVLGLSVLLLILARLLLMVGIIFAGLPQFDSSNQNLSREALSARQTALLLALPLFLHWIALTFLFARLNLVSFWNLGHRSNFHIP